MDRIIDAHHHLWKFKERDFGWMNDSMGKLKRDYLLTDLEKALPADLVSGTVAVQARQVLEETSWLLELAEKDNIIIGVVGWLDLRSEDLESQLEKYGDHPMLVGARHVIHDEVDDDFMLQPDFIQGIEMLGKYDLAYDLLLFPRHLKFASRLVSMFPEQRFVLDHISKPAIRSGVLHPWKEDIENLARHRNVWCKISGMVTEADPSAWVYEDFVPYLDVVCEAFGSQRIMIGSDWPVCKLAADYKEVMKIPLEFFKKHSIAERSCIFEKNAIDCYKLNIQELPDRETVL